MAVNSNTSFILSMTLALLIAATMQLFKTSLASSELMTIAGGFLGSLNFIFILTGINSLEKSMFGSSFQARIFPEVALSLFFAVFSSALVHRVSASTCFLFSMVHLYYINNVSHAIYSMSNVQSASLQQKKRK